MHQLSPQDAQFIYAETEHNLAHVTSVCVYDPSTVPGGGPVRYTDIIAHFRERLAYNPLFFRRLLHLPLEIDYPYWVEDEYFDLEYHMQHGRLPARRNVPHFYSPALSPLPASCPSRRFLTASP